MKHNKLTSANEMTCTAIEIVQLIFKGEGDEVSYFLCVHIFNWLACACTLNVS